MATVLTLIKQSMRKAGILTKAENPAADEAQDALDTLNDILSSWSNDSISIYARVTESFTLESGKASYTIGVGGDFNTARPIKIIQAYTTLGSTDYPMNIISDSAYQDIAFKGTGSTPDHLNYTNAYPLATLNFYPSPPGGYSFTLTSEKELTQFTLTSETVSLPPGWEKALKYNLALELQSEYGEQPNPLILKIANDSRGAIARPILKARSMDANPYSSTGNYNVNRGYR